MWSGFSCNHSVLYNNPRLMSKEEKTMLLNFENIFVMIYFSSDPGQIIVYPCQLLTDSVMMLRFDWCDPGWLWCEENMLFKGIVIMKLKFCDFRNIFPDFECPKNILVPENKKRQKFSRFHVKRKTVFFPHGKAVFGYRIIVLYNEHIMQYFNRYRVTVFYTVDGCIRVQGFLSYSHQQI